MRRNGQEIAAQVLQSLRGLAGARQRAVIVLVGLALALPSLGSRFVFDDNTHAILQRSTPGVAGHEYRGIFDLFVFVSGDREQNLAMIREGAILPWWSNPELKLSFFRPLASLSHAFDGKVWPNSPFWMHAQSLVWYGLLLLVASRVYARLAQPSWLAGLAFLLYAIDDAHAQTIAWIANRNSIMASTFALLALLAHVRWRADGPRSSGGLAVVCLSLGLLCSEFAIGVCAYLFAYAVFLDQRGWRRGLLALWPYAAVLVIWRICYRALRYGAWASDAYIDPSAEPFAFISVLPKRMAMVLLGQFGAPGADTAFWAPPAEHWLLVLLAIGWLVLLCWLLLPILRREQSARFWACGTLLAGLPVCASFSSDRTLLLVGVGGMALLAAILGRFMERIAAGERPAWFESAAVAGFGVAHLLVAPVMSPLRARSLDVAGRALERANESIPNGDFIRNKTLIIVNTPVDAFASFIHVMRARTHTPRPAHIYSLASATSSLSVTRVSESVLRMTPERGYMYSETERFWRAARTPLRLGERVELAGATAEVSALTADNRPASVTFHFDAPLESEQYVWMKWQNDRYVPFRLPVIGATERFPAEDFVKIVLKEAVR